MNGVRDGEPILISGGKYDELYVNDIHFEDEQDGEVAGEIELIQQFLGDIREPDGSDGESWSQSFKLYADRVRATLGSRHEGERVIDLNQDPYLYVRFPDGVFFSDDARVALDKYIIESYFGDEVGYNEKDGLLYPKRVFDSARRVKDSKSYPTFRIEVTDVNTPSNPVLVFIANDFTEEEAEDFLVENYNQVRWVPDNPYGYNAAKVWWGECEGSNISFIAALQNDY